MTQIWASQALLPSGWAPDVSVEIDETGHIVRVTPGAPPAGHRTGLLLPAPANAHSHAFQRAMAGLTETRGPDPRDTFWTWRQLMYRFLDRLTPDQVQAIAALVQMEMLESGYATNVEFHYLHHQPGGLPYDDSAEIVHRIVAAAQETGIGLTLLPVQYEFGGVDRRPLGPGQIRFGNTPDQFARLMDASRAALTPLPPDARIGVAPHSLRAVTPEAIRNAAALAQGSPIHMHLAEQLAEVTEVEAAYGARPVDWLLGHTEITPQWCLIHCTQMQPHETKALARTGAVAGLCPITESSLGDGIFEGLRWMEAGGRIAIGSDSNIRIALSEEIRTLDYSQRLRDHSRAALATPAHSTGRRLMDAATAGGAQAAGRNTGQIARGFLADLMALDDSHIDLADRPGDTALDIWIFAGDDRMVRDVWAAGRHMVQGGRHIARDAITHRYAAAMKPLRDAL
ncbi:formimidoylglutamate deiminase [Roseovarius azorensis]|uniref:Formimidoylglutamate deiminase n=1 Tax=Roseovarius azorensis TaxID=1287727 RepID=A0A1H7J5T5_9RHOB|nr:formimidoylglutamate deiminase [Roseovarius azorensis]SEK69966.1 formimidoylglutamate deiminase [Roseovarius azorensis]